MIYQNILSIIFITIYIYDNNDIVEYFIFHGEYSVREAHQLLLEVIKLLIDDKTNKQRNSDEVIQFLIDKIKDKDSRDIQNKLDRLLVVSATYDRSVVAKKLIDVGADNNSVSNIKPIIFNAIYHDSIETLDVLLNSPGIKSDIIFKSDTLLTYAVKRFFTLSLLKPLLNDDNIDWSHKSMIYGKEKTFFEILDKTDQDIIKKEYPEKYEKYLRDIELEKFDI